MDLDDYFTGSGHRFGGRAGILQGGGKREDFVRELADQYDEYHEELATALRAIGGRSDRRNFVGPHGFDVVAYAEHGGAIDRLLAAEGLLRWCRSAVHGGAAPDAWPFVTTSFDIFSITKDDPHAQRDGNSAAPMPDWSRVPSRPPGI